MDGQPVNFFPQKDPAEDIVLTFDFSAELNAGEAIAGAAVAQNVQYGPDTTPGQLVCGSPSIVGAQVLLTASAGLPLVRYQVSVTATLNSGRILVLAGTLPVITAS